MSVLVLLLSKQQGDFSGKGIQEMPLKQGVSIVLDWGELGQNKLWEGKTSHWSFLVRALGHWPQISN